MSQKWTKTTPIVPGEYWYRRDGNIGIISIHTDFGKLFVFDNNCKRIALLDFIGDSEVEWSGPNSEPINPGQWNCKSIPSVYY